MGSPVEWLGARRGALRVEKNEEEGFTQTSCIEGGRGVGIIMLSKTRKTEASKATTVIWRFEAMAERGATRVLLRANTLC